MHNWLRSDGKMKMLDSSFLIDFLRNIGQTPKIMEEGGPFCTTQISQYELLRGLFGKRLGEQQSQVTDLFETLPVLVLTDAAIVEAAKISAALKLKGEKIGDCDCLIAGIAKSRGISTIITKNSRHFDRISEIAVESY